MRIGFLVNQLDHRGTTWAALNYALAARDFGGHESTLLYLQKHQNPNLEVKELIINSGIKAEGVFGWSSKQFDSLNAVYHIKFGTNDLLRPSVARYWPHAVFDASEPHGERYAAVSEWLGNRDGAPWVPHIVSVYQHSQNLRRELGIPENARVFGSMGGAGSFNVPFVWDAMKWMLAHDENVWFIMAGFDPADQQVGDKRILALPTIVSPWRKRAFINTCDAMLHARNRGETFGMAVGEFALSGKPIITYALSPEQAHIDHLQGGAYLYEKVGHLIELLAADKGELKASAGKYQTYSDPSWVWRKFEEVYIK